MLTGELADEVTTWARDTARILHTCRALASRHGETSEAHALDAALEPAASAVKEVAALITADSLDSAVGPPGLAPKFCCSEPLARILSPLLHLIVTPVPDFVPRARRELPAPEAKRLVLAFGFFSGAMTDYVCEPLWKKYPDLAPSGWPL